VHYYIPGFHYYNYPYYFGLLFSRGLFSLYRREGEAFPARYRKLLAESGSARLEEIAAFVGADIGDRAFWDEALSGIDRLCAEFCSLSGSHTG
jgi:oligoendopeptidase F